MRRLDHTGYPAKTREEGSRFGLSPCIASDWGSDYFKRLKNFFHTTGMNVFENDGSYPGDPCSSTVHSGHKGYLDSQWKQWNRISSFYQWCRAKGIYLNVPDWYFLMGSNKLRWGMLKPTGPCQVLPRNYRTAEYLRWYLAENAQHGLYVRSPHPISRWWSGCHY